MYKLVKWSDDIAAGTFAEPTALAQHMIVYVDNGTVELNGRICAAGEAHYCQDYFSVRTEAEGAKLWRWGLTSREPSAGMLRGSGITSAVRMARQVKMFEMVQTSKWLFRLDKIRNFEGTTGLHSHPGSGIRCMVEGTLRAVSQKGENSYAREHGDVWYEEGAYPLVSTVDEGDKATFLRGMVLPPEYHGYPDTATWIQGFKAKYDGADLLADVVVTLF